MASVAATLNMQYAGRMQAQMQDQMNMQQHLSLETSSYVHTWQHAIVQNPVNRLYRRLCLQPTLAGHQHLLLPEHGNCFLAGLVKHC